MVKIDSRSPVGAALRAARVRCKHNRVNAASLAQHISNHSISYSEN
jgi:hypothetical protein